MIHLEIISLNNLYHPLFRIQAMSVELSKVKLVH